MAWLKELIFLLNSVWQQLLATLHENKKKKIADDKAKKLKRIDDALDGPPSPPAA